MPLLGAPVGALLVAALGDRIGRKKSILINAPFCFFCFFWLAYAKSITEICIIRFVIGATEGALYTALPMYIGEISDPEIRGFLSSTLAIAGTAGTLFINVIGQQFSILTSSMICTLVPAIHTLTFVWMPESPYYHIKRQNFKEAKRSLIILRGNDDVDTELQDLCKAVARQEQGKKGTLLDLVVSPSNRKACGIYLILCAANKFSGKNPCLFYTTTIFQESGSRLSANMSVIIYCSVELISTFLAIIVVDRFGKRLLMIISTIGCSLSVLFLGTYFYLKETNPEMLEAIDWLPITSLVAYNVLFSVGLAFGPVATLSELFPTNVKAIALGTADTVSVTMGTIASKFFQITKDAYGMHVPFWCFSACTALSLIFIIRFFPETKGKTLEEIQQQLINNDKAQTAKAKNCS